MPKPELLAGRAPAKINLTLEVLGRRPDGYHDLASVMQTLELADTVAVTLGGSGVRAEGPFATGTPCNESNLAWRAARLLLDELGAPGLQVGIRIEKRIPPAGGLGGGASDAATVLRLLGRRLGAPEEVVRRCAAAVGSDEPFFLVGGTALIGGRGELVEPLPPLPPHGIVLVVPPHDLPRKTATMFAALEGERLDDGSATARLAESLPRPVRSGDLYNRFEDVARRLVPGLAELWEEVERLVQSPFRLAGAGPTLFWIGPDEEADDVAARLQPLKGRAAIIRTRTANP